MISGSGIKFSKGIATSGRAPSARSASFSTRWSTPTVNLRLHMGQIPSASRVWAGFQQMSHFLCPSKWYLPSSG